MIRKALLSYIFLSALVFAKATVYNVPGQYSTIQAALNACTQSDTVKVQPGVYHEYIVWPATDGINLLAAGDSSNCIIDGAGFDTSVITITGTNMDPSVPYTVIRGFCIQNGLYHSQYNGGSFSYLPPAGIGICATNERLIIERCRIYNNEIIDTAFLPTSFYGTIRGAGIGLTTCIAYISNCNISGNSMMGLQLPTGAGLASVNQNPGTETTDSLYINNCIFSNNRLDSVFLIGPDSTEASYAEGAAIATFGVAAHITNCLIVNNTNARLDIIDVAGAPLIMNQTTVANNICYTAIVAQPIFYPGDIPHIYITNSILWDSATSEIFNMDTPLVISADYSDIRNGFPGLNNVSSNPMFSALGNYNLTCGSPCVNAGLSDPAVATDLAGRPRPLPAGTNPDMGCYEYNQHLTVTATPVSPTTICMGDSLRLSASQANGVVYQWQLYGANIAGANTPFLTVENAGSYNVLETDSSCTVPSNTIRVSVIVNNAHITHDADTNICSSTPLILYTLGTDPNATFTWFLNGNPIAGAQSFKYAADSTGSYSVAITDGGCIDTSQSVAVSVLPSPVAPVIRLSHDTLYSDVAQNIQWYLNGHLLTGRTESTCLIEGIGVYTCMAYGPNGCSSVSNSIGYGVGSVNNVETPVMDIYPIPAGNQLTVNFSQPFTGNLKVINVTGEMVYQQSLNSTTGLQVNVEQLPAALYLLMVSSSTHSQLLKFVVVH